MTFRDMPVNIVLSGSIKRPYKKIIGQSFINRKDNKIWMVNKKRVETVNYPNVKPYMSYSIYTADGYHKYITYYKLRKYYV